MAILLAECAGFIVGALLVGRLCWSLGARSAARARPPVPAPSTTVVVLAGGPPCHACREAGPNSRGLEPREPSSTHSREPVRS
jgi:cytochrome b